MRASIGVTGYPASTHSLRRRANAPPHSRGLCVAAGTAPSPFLDGRKSAVSTACANVCASICVTGYPKIGKLPVPSRHRSPILSQTVRGGQHSPITVSRQSRIRHVNFPCQHACMHRIETHRKQTDCAVAPSLYDLRADCAPPPAQSQHLFSVAKSVMSTACAKM